MKLDLLREGDTRAALELSVAQGWNQTAADWQRLMSLEPSGCFAARAGHRLIGTVTTTTYGRSLAWIGMMIVHPDFRRKGIGVALMRRALDSLQRLGVPSLKLDATPAGRPLYESLGFVAETEIERWQGVASVGTTPGPQGPRRESLAPLLALDKAAYGADRSRLLRLLVADGVGAPLVVRSAGGTPQGYALARQGRGASYVGPVVGTTAGAAEKLLDKMVVRLAGEVVCLDLHRGGPIEPSALAERGLSKRRSLMRMRFGPGTAACTTGSLCASAGPELG